MPKRSTALHVPKDMQARFEEITHLTGAFCHTYLDQEYVQLSRELTATRCRKRPSPLERGKATVWASGIIHALGMVNFLFDSSQQTPHIAVSQIWEYFKLSSSTMQAKSKQICDLLGMYPMDPDWSTPSMADQNPLIWMRRLSMDWSSMCAMPQGRFRRPPSADTSCEPTLPHLLEQVRRAA